MKNLPTLSALHAFVTVAREGSVSAAADVLNLTQPAVSHQIKRLSEDSGVALFQRTPTGLQLTAEGAKLIPQAERTLAAAAEFQRHARNQLGRVSGKLRIGTIVDPEFIRLGQLLKTLNHDFPGIETELRHGISGETIDRLRRGQLDAGFYLSAPKNRDASDRYLGNDLQATKLADFSYRVVGPAGWQKRIENATWKELSAMPWIGTPELSIHNRLLTKIFQMHNCVQNVVARVDQEASMLEMVRSGVGLCLSREAIALSQKQTSGLALCQSVNIPACLNFVTPKIPKSTLLVSAVTNVIEELWHLGPHAS